MNVEAPTRDLNLMENSITNEVTDEYDYLSDYEDDYDEFSDDSNSEDQMETSKETQNDSLSSDVFIKNKISNKKISSNGPLVDNIVLKEISTVKRYTPEESSMFALNYIDWITEDPNCLIQFDETLKMGTNCWNYMEYLPHLKSFSHFVIPLMGIVASEAAYKLAFWKQKQILGDLCTNMSIELEKAKMSFANID